MEIVKDILVNTPWWVYLLLVVLIQMGVRASKTGVVHLGKLTIAPLIFTYMAIETLVNNLVLTPYVYSVFAGTLLLGILLGWIQVSMQSLRFDKAKWLIEVPGTWTVMLVIIIIFVAKYYFGYALSVDPNVIHNSFFEVMFIGVTAVCTGLFIGKFLCYMKRMYTEQQTDLIAD